MSAAQQSSLSHLETECETAVRRIAPHVRRTPVEYSRWLSDLGGAAVHLKLENQQLTGSFKLRGATNALLSLAEPARTVVAASSGNHGLAVAHASLVTGARALIFVPEAADASKLRGIEDLGAEVRRVPGDPVDAEVTARRHARENGLPYLSPYNDPAVVAGQGTIGVELAEDFPRVDVLFVSLGGGGLAAGTGGYLKAVRGTRVVACSPENSPVMHESLKAGRILDLPSLPTLSDGTAGGVEKEAITFEMCRSILDSSLTVSEDEIAAALRLVIERHHTLIEGAAAVAVAGYMQTAHKWKDRNVAIVLCGANIDPQKLRSVLAG